MASDQQRPDLPLRLHCTACDRRHPITAQAWACSDCGGLLEVERDVPAAAPAPLGSVYLGEGGTPLVLLRRWGARLGLEQVYAKLEFAGPTGSFKDRGAATLVSAAVSAGATRLVEDSSGNAGAAIAAYAAHAGLACTIFAPASAPAAKLRQIAAYGAELVRVEGPREAVTAAAISAARADPGAYYASHNTNPLFVEGCKAFAHELAEAFEGGPPEHVVMPVAGGALYQGAWLGFLERRGAGTASRLPRLHMAQADGCAPLAAAFDRGLDDAAPIHPRPTVAGGIEIPRPPRAKLLLAALRASGGTAVAVSDAAILEAQAELARTEGIYGEPTSATAFAAVSELARRGLLGGGERVVVAVTGSGLKGG